MYERGHAAVVTMMHQRVIAVTVTYTVTLDVTYFSPDEEHLLWQATAIICQLVFSWGIDDDDDDDDVNSDVT